MSSRLANYTGREELQNLIPLEVTVKTKRQKRTEIVEQVPLPAHWQPISPSARFSRLRNTVFVTLCLTAFGDTSMDNVWAIIKLEGKGDDSGWDEGMREVVGRMEKVLVVVRLKSDLKNFIWLTIVEAALLLATSAALITTEAPRATIMNYTLRTPYICLLSSAGLLLGGISVAAGAVQVISKARPEWVERVSINSYSSLVYHLLTEAPFADTIFQPCPRVLHAYPGFLPILLHCSFYFSSTSGYANTPFQVVEVTC